MIPSWYLEYFPPFPTFQLIILNCALIMNLIYPMYVPFLTIQKQAEKK
jgi:hypothetical protein